MKRRRIQLSIPEDLLRDIDWLAGLRGRSRFFVAAAIKELRRRKLLKFLENAAPAWKEEDHPELAAGSAAWVRRLRGES